MFLSSSSCRILARILSLDEAVLPTQSHQSHSTKVKVVGVIFHKGNVSTPRVSGIKFCKVPAGRRGKVGGSVHSSKGWHRYPEKTVPSDKVDSMLVILRKSKLERSPSPFYFPSLSPLRSFRWTKKRGNLDRSWYLLAIFPRLSPSYFTISPSKEFKILPRNFSSCPIFTAEKSRITLRGMSDYTK